MIYTNLAAIKTAVEAIGTSYYKSVNIGWKQKVERQKLPVVYIIPDDGDVTGYQVVTMNVRVIAVFFDQTALYSTMDAAITAMADAMRSSCAFLSKTFTVRFNPPLPEITGWDDFMEPLGAFELTYTMSSHVRN